MNAFELLLSTISPHQCLVCRAEGSLLCKLCKTTISPAQQQCYRCGIEASEGLCEACRPVSPLQSLTVTTSFTGTAQQLIYALKFGRMPAAAATIASLMDGSLQNSCTIVAHIPTATSRVRRRGYDQSALIARQLTPLLGASYASLLIRQGQQRQLGQNRTQRLNQLKHAYSINNRFFDEQAVILLVDDVITTGSTLEAAAATLRHAGAREVHGAVFAAA